MVSDEGNFKVKFNSYGLTGESSMILTTVSAVAAGEERRESLLIPSGEGRSVQLHVQMLETGGREKRSLAPSPEHVLTSSLCCPAALHHSLPRAGGPPTSLPSPVFQTLLKDNRRKDSI